MPIMIKEPDLERRLEEHAERMVARTSKAELIRSIAAVVLDAADRDGVDVGQLLVDMRRTPGTRKPPKAA